MSENDRNLEAPLPKGFEPEGVEERWYRFWEENGLFAARPDSGREPFCIVIPPPNVTGALHMGHALNNGLQDIVIRWKRMCGHDVLWVPGTDHAGIATQAVVERDLATQGKSRHDIGREKFVEKAWAWREKHGGLILEQLRRLGCALDWDRTRFTLDEMLSRAVREVFVSLYEDGLIYRAERIVNWCPRCDTALSDLEVDHRELAGTLTHIRYPLADGTGEVVVATTRPETMLGDTGVAVHPDDKRYAEMVGKTLTLPLVGRAIPIVADEIVEQEFGTGAVKVTPGHDPNDFEIGQRHGLEIVSAIDREARMTDQVPEEFRGMDRYACRKAVVKKLKKTSALVEIEDYSHQVGHCFRCGTVVEPLVSLQWFVEMEPLAKPAMEAVAEGRIRIDPDNWVKVYMDWLGQIRDWCISRQLWWGHRIPAWFCEKCDGITVERTDPKKCAHCGSRKIRQEEDVLDTWFSSALWPFSTMGWPEKTVDLERYYPTSILITAFDILFFWVARMIMMGLRFPGEIPFHDVYLHGLIRDKDNKKMSKTTGNVVDPLELIDKYGADALRFTLTAMTTGGTDFPIDYDPAVGQSPRMKGYRAFCNKLWNATRFLLMNLEGREIASEPAVEPDDWPERWILARHERAVRAAGEALEGNRFHELAHGLYHFVWGELCDWYIEMAKPYLSADDERGARARGVALHVVESTLRLLHPVIPFITEELWQKLPAQGEGRPVSIMDTAYPQSDPARLDEEAERRVGLWTELTTKARNTRVGVGIEPGRRVPLELASDDPSVREMLEAGRQAIGLLAKCDPVTVHERLPAEGPSTRGVVTAAELRIPLEGIVDAEKERARHRKEMDKLEGELGKVTRKLSSESFLAKAPPEVVEKTRRILEELQEKKQRIEETLASLEG